MEAIIQHQNKNLFYINLVLLSLSIFDALMTLWGIDRGAIEEILNCWNWVIVWGNSPLKAIESAYPGRFEPQELKCCPRYLSKTDKQSHEQPAMKPTE